MVRTKDSIPGQYLYSGDVYMNAVLLIDAPHAYCESFTSETTTIEA